jgi:hypothetical protein
MVKNFAAQRYKNFVAKYRYADRTVKLYEIEIASLRSQ